MTWSKSVYLDKRHGEASSAETVGVHGQGSSPRQHHPDLAPEEVADPAEQCLVEKWGVEPAVLPPEVNILQLYDGPKQRRFR